MTGGWRKLHNKELNYNYSPSNIIRVIKTRRLVWVEHVAYIERFGLEALTEQIIWKTSS
jgi:hypothetical protein